MESVDFLQSPAASQIPVQNASQRFLHSYNFNNRFPHKLCSRLSCCDDDSCGLVNNPCVPSRISIFTSLMRGGIPCGLLENAGVYLWRLRSTCNAQQFIRIFPTLSPQTPSAHFPEYLRANLPLRRSDPFSFFWNSPSLCDSVHYFSKLKGQCTSGPAPLVMEKKHKPDSGKGLQKEKRPTADHGSFFLAEREEVQLLQRIHQTRDGAVQFLV